MLMSLLVALLQPFPASREASVTTSAESRHRLLARESSSSLCHGVSNDYVYIRLQVPRAVLLPFSSTQEDTGFCEVSWKRTENSGTTPSEVFHNSGSAEWDGCFELIPPGFPGPLGPPHASDKRRGS